ncbi:MAG: class I SAM-dependent methyltransferase [Tardiphaga sp.]
MRQDNYIRDIGYTAGFYPQTAPHWLAFAAIVAGRAPGAALRPKRVYELGMGQGFGLALLAAANPDVSFEGCDFNPDHVAQARRFIVEAKLPNMAVHEMSFADAAQAGAASDIDAAIAHGILSWVAPDVQRDVVAFLRRRLGGEGTAHVSYNCAVGWAPLAPIRSLFLEVRRRMEGGSQAQVTMALDWMQRLRRTHAPLFAANPAAARHFDSMLAEEPAYLAHEYLAEAAQPLNFSEVAALLGGAGLSYAASANLIENVDALGMPAAALPLLAQAEDPVLRETLRDFAVNRFFRRDLFSRADHPLTPGQQREALARFRFMLAVPRAQLRLDFHGPAGPLTGAAGFYGPLADRMVDGAGLDELAHLPAVADAPFERLLQALVLLVESRQVHLVPVADGIDVEPARRFNRMVVDAARRGVVYGHLASPVTGSGVAVSDLDLLALAAIADGAALDPEMIARRGLAIIAALGRRPMRDGVAIWDDVEAIEFLAEPMRHVVEHSLPLWQRLGITG